MTAQPSWTSTRPASSPASATASSSRRRPPSGSRCWAPAGPTKRGSWARARRSSSASPTARSASPRCSPSSPSSCRPTCRAPSSGSPSPWGWSLLLLERYAARQVLHALRLRGKCLHRAVAVGSLEEVELLVRTVQREPYAGLQVVAVSLPDYEMRVPDRRGRAAARARARPGRPARAARHRHRRRRGQLGDVEPRAARARLAARGPRDRPRRRAGAHRRRRARASTSARSPACRCCTSRSRRSAGRGDWSRQRIDYLGALVLRPAAPAARAWSSRSLVKRDSQGPVFYRQERVGKDGRPSGSGSSAPCGWAPTPSCAALAALNEHDGPLFKMRSDPRVTRVGARAAQVLPRRAAADPQRAGRLDEPGRPAAAAAQRGRRRTPTTCTAGCWSSPA